MSSIDVCSDAFLWGREAYRMVSDHKNGTRPIIGPSWRISPDGPKVERGAPLLGRKPLTTCRTARRWTPTSLIGRCAVAPSPRASISACEGTRSGRQGVAGIG